MNEYEDSLFIDVLVYCATNYTYEIISIFLLAIVFPILAIKFIAVLWDIYKELTE